MRSIVYQKVQQYAPTLALVGAFLFLNGGQAQASYSEVRSLYDWGIPTSGPRVLADENTPPTTGTKISGYVVELEGKTYLAEPGEGLQRIDLPPDVNLEDVKGKFVATEVGSTEGDVAKLSLAVPAPAPTASADATAASANTTTNETAPTLPDPGIKPDSRFLSFFDRTGENVGRFFVFSATARAKYDAEVADERLAETKALLEENKPEAAQLAANSYSSAVAKVGNSIASISDANQTDVEQIRKDIAGHAALLQTDLITSAPEEFRNAINNASESTGKALAAIADKRGEPPLTPETIQRIQSAVALGSMPPSAAAAIFGAKNRTEALATMESQVKSGLVASPDADYLRYDAVRQTYKDSFEKGHEINKLEYIRKTQDEIKKIGEDPALKQQIQDFGNNFTEGQQPPEAIRKYWALSVNAENAQQTFRPEVLKDVLKADSGKNEDFTKFYATAKENLRPTQAEAENLARQQSGSSVLLPQFQRVLQQVSPGVRGENPDGQTSQREGFNGCKNADECVAKAKEFQDKFKDSTEDQRRAIFQQEFNRVNQVNQASDRLNSQRQPGDTPPAQGGNLNQQLRSGIPVGQPQPGTDRPNDPQNRPNSGSPNGQSAFRPAGENGNANNFFNSNAPAPRVINEPGNSAPRPNEPAFRPGESRQGPAAPNGPRDANRPAGQGPSSGSAPNNPSSGGSGGGGPAPHVEEHHEESHPSGGDSGGGAPPPGGGGDSGGGAPPGGDGGGGFH